MLKEILENINEAKMGAFEKDVYDIIVKKLGFKQIKSVASDIDPGTYRNSNDEYILVFDDEFVRNIELKDMSSKTAKDIDKAIKPLLKKYNGSLNKLSGGTEYEFFDKE